MAYLCMYRITPNPNTNTNMSPAELIFARKIRAIFDKLILLKKGSKKKLIPLIRFIVQGKNLFPKLSFGQSNLVRGYY